MKKIFISLLASLIGNLVLSQDLKPADWPHLTGYWKFQNIKNLTRASVGNDLNLVGKHQLIQGPSYDDTAVRVPLGSYYRCRHAIAPNGGGDSVNTYSLMFDFKVKNFDRWHTFFQTDSSNANDGECFIRPSTGSNPGCIGTATTGYTSNPIKPNVWYRLVISVNLNHFYRYYLNGSLILEGDTQEVDGRFAMLPQVLFFADNNNEDDTIDIASIAIFDTCLSSKEIAKIGSLDPCIANPPKVDLGRDTTLCANLVLSLNAGTNFTSYQWSTGSKLPFEYINSNTLGIGEKKVWVKVVDRNGCSGGDTVIIKYLPLPLAQLGNDTIICEGEKVQLAVVSNKSYTYLWQNLLKSTILSTTNTLTVNSTGNYMVMVSTVDGCIKADSIQIDVYLNPLKPKINTVGSPSFCAGDSVKLEGPGSYKQYFWSNGFTKQHQTIFSSIKIALKVMDQFGCISPVSDSLIIKQNPLPPKPDIQLVGSVNICDGDSVIFKADSGYVKYNWQDGVGNAIRVVKKPGIFSVRVVDVHQCVSEASDKVQTSVLNLPAKPSITIKGKSILCQGQTTELNTSSGYKSYLWTDSVITAKNTIFKQGNYRVKVKDNNGCFSIWSDPVFIQVTPTPAKPKVVKSIKDSLQCNIIANRYKWLRNSTLIQDTTRSVLPLTGGNYQVQIYENACWSAFSDSFNYIVAAISSSNFHNKLKIYPNPAEDKLDITLDSKLIHGEYQIEVFTIFGQKVIELNQNAAQMTDSFNLSVSGLSSGKYIICVTSDKHFIGTFVKK